MSANNRPKLFSEGMIRRAITALNEEEGSSLEVIEGYIVENEYNWQIPDTAPLPVLVERMLSNQSLKEVTPNVDSAILPRYKLTCTCQMPLTEDMIRRAITALNKEEGSSMEEIELHIVTDEYRGWNQLPLPWTLSGHLDRMVTNLSLKLVTDNVGGIRRYKVIEPAEAHQNFDDANCSPVHEDVAAPARNYGAPAISLSSEDASTVSSELISSDRDGSGTVLTQLPASDRDGSGTVLRQLPSDRQGSSDEADPCAPDTVQEPQQQQQQQQAMSLTEDAFMMNDASPGTEVMRQFFFELHGGDEADDPFAAQEQHQMAGDDEITALWNDFFDTFPD